MEKSLKIKAIQKLKRELHDYTKIKSDTISEYIIAVIIVRIY